MQDVSATSPMGQRLMAKATRDLQNNNAYGNYNANAYNNGNNANVDYGNNQFEHAWLAGYSIKFQGCHHISQWNVDANNEADVRITTKRLVRFRLCRSNSCENDSSYGCTSDYGDYIVDLSEFLEAYLENQQSLQEYQSQQYEQQMQYYQEQYKQQYGDEAAENYEQYNNYQKESQNSQYEVLQQGITCSQANFRRMLAGDEEASRDLQNQYYAQAYVGPYCASQGGAVYLGVFVDDACTTFADTNGGRDTYRSRVGSSLPFGSTSIVNNACISCKESYGNVQKGDYNYQYYANDMADADDVSQMCEELYDKSGKCESSLQNTNFGWDKNTNACNYMEGIKIVRKDGTVVSRTVAQANRSASAVAGLLTVAFAGLAGYVYFLKNKLDRASINLED